MTENSVAHTGPDPDTKKRNDTSDKMRMDSTDREAGGLEAGAKKAEHGAAAGIHSSPKKRRKVNHGMRHWSPRAVQGLWKRDSASCVVWHPSSPNSLLLGLDYALLANIWLPFLQRASIVADR